MRKTFVLIAALAMLVGCGGGTTPAPSQGGESPLDSVIADSLPIVGSLSQAERQGGVSTMGKVVAARFADLAFETSLPIQRVLVRNGQQVRRGQVLAQLDQYKLRNVVEQQQRAIEQAQLQIEQAQLQMQDVIISQGYDPDNAAAVPAEVRHNADVKSGYALSKAHLAAARTQLAAAQHDLHSGVLTAPFDGVVANLSIQPHQLAQAGQVACRVIATGDMEVEFRVMEADLHQYAIGTVVGVIPVADKTKGYSATVSEINPIVDQQGAVTLRARLAAASDLFDGMNVEVILKLTMDN